MVNGVLQVYLVRDYICIFLMSKRGGLPFPSSFFHKKVNNVFRLKRDDLMNGVDVYFFSDDLQSFTSTPAY